ncbi:MAG: MBL fold metallo-hydrolase [Clostridiales bacterium]|nr:MBL fold metallo-hydrolase [Clostridiales bacterium]
MHDWFTIEKIDSETWVISEYKHWEQTHCYLLIDSKQAVLIDTGLGVSNIKQVIDSLTELPVLVVTTHVHWDHIGGHGFFDDIAVHEADAEWLNHFPVSLSVVKSNLLKRSCDFPKDFDIDNYQVFQGKPTRLLKDGDIIDFGNRQLMVIHTPGHSPGHICLYEPERGYFFSGDLIYKGCLDAFYPSTNPADFMRSVHRIRALHVWRLLPGHHALDVSADLISEVDDGFRSIDKQGKLKQGNGIFQFKNFSIHI